MTFSQTQYLMSHTAVDLSVMITRCQVDGGAMEGCGMKGDFRLRLGILLEEEDRALGYS